MEYLNTAQIYPVKRAIAIDDNPTAATGTLTSNNTNVTDGKVVVIGAVTYRFKNTMAQVNDVKIGADANGTLGNLEAAVNGAAGAGTKYFTGTVANPAVSAGATNTTNHTILMTAKTAGYAGNSLASTTDETTLSWGGTTLSGGGSTIGTAAVGHEGGFVNQLIVITPNFDATPTTVLTIQDADGTVFYTSSALNESTTTRIALSQLIASTDVITCTTNALVSEASEVIVLLR